MRLEDIGFYTLSEKRVQQLSSTSPMWRCEIIITGRCNFKCPYCRGPEIIQSDAKKDLSSDQVFNTLNYWIKDGLKNIRFSGGEPTLHSDLSYFVNYCKNNKVERIAVSTNGSNSITTYNQLLFAGVNDFSISLDACCSSAGHQMTGREGQWEKVVTNIGYLAKRTYVSVGVVLTEDNLSETIKVIDYAHSLGVSDIRIIPSAQNNKNPENLDFLSEEIREAHPILNYRVNNILTQKEVRGISNPEHNRCYLVMDDSAVAGNHHFPCIIYMREGGSPIGEVGPNMRQERINWSESHNVYTDSICRANCLDVCCFFNERCSELCEF